MDEFHQLTLQPILAVLVKLRIQLEIKSKARRAIDYALWDLVSKYHSCSGLLARTAIQIILHGIYFVPGPFLEIKQKRDMLAYAIIPISDENQPFPLLHYQIALNSTDERSLRKVVLGTPR